MCFTNYENSSFTDKFPVLIEKNYLICRSRKYFPSFTIEPFKE